MNSNDKKRVRCLYRVSTAGQVEKDDIPMQKQRCHEFAAEQGWEIVEEHYEKGVSGYEKSIFEREEPQKIHATKSKRAFAPAKQRLRRFCAVRAHGRRISCVRQSTR